MKYRLYFFAGCLLGAASYLSAALPETDARIERGRYITQVAGCNDCHTANYAVSDGNIPVSEWLRGDTFGWRGPWGTTYGTNLRLFVSTLSEQQWIEAARTLRRRPPMPWFNLNAMSDEDLGAMYSFIRSLGEPGLPAPTAIPPEQAPQGPYANWVMP